MINYDHVISTSIRALGYKDGVVYVEFLAGKRHAYKMAPEMFKQFREAKSIGQFYARNVRKKLEAVWNGWCCDASPCKRDATMITGPGWPHPFRLCDEHAKDPRHSHIQFLPIPEEPKGEK